MKSRLISLVLILVLVVHSFSVFAEEDKTTAEQMTALAMLNPGDTILVDGEAILVESVDFGDWVSINGGLDAGGVELATREDTNGYCVSGYDDMTTYTEQGVTTLVLADDASFTDAWDIESEPVTVTGAEIVTAMQTSTNDYFVRYNTTVRIEGGVVVEINRVYVP